jgi:hypothetical protein
MSGWKSTIPTERLYGDARFLRLPERDQDLLLRVYTRCDKWGRGPAHPNVLPFNLMVVRTDVRAQLDRIAASGLVTVYEVAGEEYYQVTGYDDDIFADQKRKRQTSNYPPPPGSEYAHGQTESAKDLPSRQAEPAHGLPRVEKSNIAEHSGSTPRAPAAARPPAPTRAYEPPKSAPKPAEQAPPPSDPRVLVALARWQRRLTLAVPHAAIDDDSVLTVARDFAAEVFVEAVERHVEEDREFWVKTPLRYLRRRCEFVQRDRERAPPTHEPRRSSKPRGEAYPPCDPDAKPEIVGPPRIAQGVT